MMPKVCIEVGGNEFDSDVMMVNGAKVYDNWVMLHVKIGLCFWN